MSEQTVTLTELPEKPVGWTRRMVCHLNFGREGSSASYEILDDQGRLTQIGYGWNTAGGQSERGFFVNGSRLMPWAELRARWAELTQVDSNG